MENTPLISVIVPVYKVEKWLPDCIESVLAQTLENWECILVDDGSPDGCPAICDAAAQKDPRFKVVHKPNGGLSSARNSGLAAAKGRWVAFLDSDDAIAPRLLETALELQQSDPDAMVTWPLAEEGEEFRAACEKQPSSTASSYKALCWRDTLFVNACTRLYDMDFLRKTGLSFDEKLGFANSAAEDLDFNQRYCPARWPKENFKVLLIDQPLYFYRQDNENSIMHEKRRAEADRESFELPQPESGYCGMLLKECESAKETFKSTEDRDGLRMYLLHYLRCLAFGVWSAKALGEKLPENFFSDERLADLLALCKEHKIYSAYFVPFRLKNAALCRKMYQWDETKNIWYWRFYEIFYQLFCRGWQK